MACLIPKRIVNRHYKKIAPDSHFRLYHETLGQFPKQDYYINVDCGRCINCFKKYMSSWRFRLLHEFYSMSHDQLSRTFFVTLTMENRFYSENSLVLKKMVRRFLERVRKKYKKSIRHFLVTERGDDTNRIHFHGFFIDTHVPMNDIYNLWYYGFVKIVPVVSPDYPLSQKVSYCTSYVTKGKKGKLDLVVPPENWPIVLVSPGIGLSYVKNFRSQHFGSTLFPMTYEFNGTPRSLPRYLRGKVFNEEQLKSLKDQYFAEFSEDVIPDPPYFIGNVSFVDYSLFLKECKIIKSLYFSIYGK